MSVLSQRSARVDLVRAATVAVLAVVQILVSAMAGGSVGAVAESLRNAAAGGGLGVHDLGADLRGFPGLRGLPAAARPAGARDPPAHRLVDGRVGGVQSAVDPRVLRCGLILLAELLLVALLVVLAVVFGRLSREPAADRVERAAFRGPLALYTGWVSMATVLGTAATGVWAGLPGDNALAAIAAVVVLLAAAGIVAWVVLSGTAVVAYAAAVVWALIGIALNAPPAAVVVACAIAIVVVLAATLRRVTTRGQPGARRLGLGRA